MVRLIDVMKKIIVLFVFLPFSATGQEYTCKTDSIEDYPPDPQYDRTESQIDAINEIIQLLDKQTMSNTLDEWISRNQTFDTPWTTMNSKNITITKFKNDKNIIPISSLIRISGVLNSYLLFDFNNKLEVMQVDGTIKFLRPENYSSCQMAFTLNFEFILHQIIFQNMNNPIYRNYEEIYTLVGCETINLAIVELNETSCENLDEERSSNSISYDILKATEKLAKERAKLIMKSAFQSLSQKWVHPDNNTYARRENDYSRFKLHHNNGTFPWLFDHNEFIINGLNNFVMLDMEYLSNGETTYELFLKGVRIRWNIASVIMMQRSFDIRELIMRGSINELLLMKDLEISLIGIVELSNQDYITELDEEFVKNLEVLIANGIKQTTRKIRYDNTETGINVIREILRLFDKKLFKRTLVNIEKYEKKFPVGTISILKLDMEAFQLKNITWSHSDKLEVGGTIRYEKIEGQANVLLPIVNNKVHEVPISVNLSIQETTFGISLKHSNSSNDDEVQIKVDWNEKDTIIMITSSYYHLSRQERIEIGKQTFQYFTETIGNQIIEVTKSTFRPIFDIYKNSFNNTTHTTGTSENFDNQQRYFAVIHDYWTNTTESSTSEAVGIIMEGSWNFKPINIQYTEGKLSIGGLQLENVTATVEQFSSLNKSVITNYTTNSISITINHMENDVIVHVSSHHQNITGIIGKLESTVASFIGYSIYVDLTKDSNYHTNFRRLVNKTTTKAILEDTKFAYDASSQIANNFVRILKDKESSFLTPIFDYMKHTSMSLNRNYYISNETAQQIEPLNVSLIISEFVSRLQTTNSPIQEESCIYSTNSSNTHMIAKQLVITGKINLRNFSNKFDVLVSFLVNSSRVGNIFDNDFNETAQIYIDDKNIEDTLRSGKSAFDFNNKTVKTEFALLASSILRSHFKKNPSTGNFCKLGFNSTAPPQTHFFSISGVVNYSSQLFSTYYIKLYGLNNFKMLRRVYSTTVTEFEIPITNLTARIIWNHYNGDYIRRTPKIMNLQIREITLNAKVLPRAKWLIFTNKSRMLVSNQDNSSWATMVKEKIEKIVINAIQQAIRQEYNKINRN